MKDPLLQDTKVLILYFSRHGSVAALAEKIAVGVAAAGATAIIQPGGSIRDNEVIEAADKAGLAMVFTGMRHFRH